VAYTLAGKKNQLFFAEEHRMIPKTVHFIWVGGGEWKSKYTYGIYSVLKNTTMKPVLHTDDKTITLDGIEIRHIEDEYKNITFSCVAHKADIVRCDILYKEGGIYSDLDVIWLRNPTEHFKKQLVIGYSNKQYRILCNAIIMAEKNNELLLDYKKWLLSIMPCKKYWIPANPYKLWKDKQVFFADRKDFFPIRYDATATFTYEDVKNSICVHLFSSMNDIELIYNRVFKDIFD